MAKIRRSASNRKLSGISLAFLELEEIDSIQNIDKIEICSELFSFDEYEEIALITIMSIAYDLALKYNDMKNCKSYLNFGYENLRQVSDSFYLSSKRLLLKNKYGQNKYPNPRYLLRDIIDECKLEKILDPKIDKSIRTSLIDINYDRNKLAFLPKILNDGFIIGKYDSEALEKNLYDILS